jgi:cytochrome bd ubiquinol oxidase subunit II
MTTTPILAAIMIASLVLYVLLAGADFGAGFWDLLSAGSLKDAQRDLIARAIQPIWEANHVWLILIFVLLFSGFPSAFGDIMILLYAPILLMLLGIVLRGSAFVFRAYSSAGDRMRRTWARIFSVSSSFTPFFAGVIVGSLSDDHATIGAGATLNANSFNWLNPFSVSVGLLTLAIFAFLAASYLTVEAESHELKSIFRRRAVIAAFAAISLAIVTFILAGADARGFRDGLLHTHLALACEVGAVIAILVVLVALFSKRDGLARLAAASFACTVVLGWASAQYPYLIRPDRTIFNSVGSETTVQDIVLASIVGAFVLFPSLALLLYVFKDQKRNVSATPSTGVPH